MPQPSFHLQLASEILDAWADQPGACPFDPDSNACTQAFLHGSIGPDLGFFPGATRILATLAHSTPTGDLIREMLARAHGERETAFTYGWATHVLADAIMHPLINQAAADVLGVPLSVANPTDVQHLHIRLEIGLELVMHGARVSTDALAAAHRRVCRILGPMLALQSSMAFARTDGAAVGAARIGPPD